MPESTAGSTDDLDAIADELYALPPDAFVPARDDRVAVAKEAGERDLARALARLRRPTRAAWLANLLARHRSAQLDGLVALSHGLAQAQQELDGATLRTLSGQRHKAVAAMARDAGRLAARQGEAVNEALLRDLQGILDAALADPAIAEEVRAGRLTKTVRYSGFGPGDDVSAWAVAPAPARRPTAPTGPTEDGAPAEPDADADADPEPDTDADRAERARAERDRAARAATERAAREQALAEAEEQEAAARERQEDDETARDRADERHATARTRVADLAAELDAARTEEQAALEATREAATAVRAASREAAAAAARTARARARLDQLPPA